MLFLPPSELHDYVLTRHRSGVKLIREMSKKGNRNVNNPISFKNLLNMPCLIYIDRRDHSTVYANDICAKFNGFISSEDMIDKHPFQWAKNPLAIIEPHEEVMQSNQLKIFDQVVQTIHSQKPVKLLSIQFPWYDNDDNIVGIFGCSISTDKQSPSLALTQLVALGLLTPSSTNPLLENAIFSKRERDCIELLLQGKTSKQIGKALSLSHRTIEHYIETIKSKVGVSSKLELILIGTSSH